MRDLQKLQYEILKGQRGYWLIGSPLLVPSSGSCDIHLNWNTRCRLCNQKPPPAQFTILQVRSQGLTSYPAVFARNTNNMVIQVMIHLHKDYSELTNQNNELKFRLKAMEQHNLEMLYIKD
ncbi:uncharacterized protein LOC142546284 isoform X2 [Primulina tabacum]|uniref:uncharacterized protein LOC142546284 isoform X2 n=1 Tax=Primulina tabacum TaxID=48773 RepID=UPI003F5A93FD